MVRTGFMAFFLSVVSLSVAALSSVELQAQQILSAAEMKEEIVSVKRVALIIGNSAYKKMPLKNPINDAKLMTQTLQSMGFEVISVFDANRRSVMLAIQDFGGKLDEYGRDTIGLFYFAGHGVQSDGVNYLIPVEANIQKKRHLSIEAIKSQDLLEQLRNARNATNIIILDACRNNPYSGTFRSLVSGLAGKTKGAPKGSLVAFSTAPGKASADGWGNNSPYVLALIQQMLVPGQGVLDVFANTAKIVAGKTGDEQIPWYESSSLTNDSFYFTDTVLSTRGARLAERPGVTAPIFDKEAMFWQSIQNSKEATDFQAYLQTYPGGDFALLARNRMVGLKKAEVARHRKELIASEQADPRRFWHDATPEQVALLVSNAQAESWPVFAIDSESQGEGLSRLHIAASVGNSQAVRLLLRKGANVNAHRQNRLMTPLHDAAVKGHEQVVRLLLAQDADIESRDSDQCTPLHLAAANGRIQAVHFLLEKGANIEARTKAELRPLHWAALGGHVRVVRLLLEKGADAEARDKYGKTALDAAKRKGKTKVVDLLRAKQK